jgi:stearoyl-CoA desaturase (Delta-9 desaturase)
MLLFGLLPVPIWCYLLYTLILTHITVIGNTIFLHRHQAHRALDLHPIVSHFFRFWLWLTTSIATSEWVAVHRKHHTESDTAKDPHSPQVYGLKKVLFEGSELYEAEAKNQETIERYGKNTPNDWLEKYIYSSKKFKQVGVVLMLLLNIFLFGIPGIAIWAIQMMWIPFFAGGVINGIGHFWGYRNFECPDAARNIMPVGILMGGEELHNNHHTFAASAKLSVRWFEFDIGWFYISILQCLKLAKVHRSIPKLNMNKAKLTLDSDSLKAIISNRSHIMHDYWREVIVPIVKNEKQFLYKHSRHLIKNCSKLLVRENTLIKQDEHHFLQTILKERSVFQIAYNFHHSLQEVWHMTNISHQELLEILNRWCKQAEATGIAALQNFAKRLHCYSL